MDFNRWERGDLLDGEDDFVAAESAEPESAGVGLVRKGTFAGLKKLACDVPRLGPAHADRGNGGFAGRRQAGDGRFSVHHVGLECKIPSSVISGHRWA